MKTVSATTSDLLVFKELNDAIINETKSRQFKELEIEHETEKKESEIRAKDQTLVYLTRKINFSKVISKKAPR